MVEFSADSGSKSTISRPEQKSKTWHRSPSGNEPRDVSKENVGYDIESREPERDGRPSRLRFIEVEGRAKGATTVTVTRNEVLCALNEPDSYILAIGIVDGSDCDLRYIRCPFSKDVEFSMTIEVDIGKIETQWGLTR